MRIDVENVILPGARIAIVGEAPGADEVKRGLPFVGASGQELTRMLAEAGIERSECSILNVCRERPPGNDISHFFSRTKTAARQDGLSELAGKYPRPVMLEALHDFYAELDRAAPEVIIALGETALWALTGQSGIGKFRGSYMRGRNLLTGEAIPGTIIPTYHPAAVLRMWAWRWIAVHDLRRAARPVPPAPEYRFTIRPSFDAVMAAIDRARSAPIIAVDIETREQHIACLGFAWSDRDAICIPFMSINPERPSYWPAEEEIAIVRALRDLLTHVPIVGQNFLYDAQYIARYWGFIPRLEHDTMLEHHAIFSGLPKGLDFLSSLYCTYHEYWKDEGKTWDPRFVGEEQLWTYNCKDCVITFEAHREILRTGEQLGMRDVQERQMRLWRPALTTMLRGVRIDTTLRERMTSDLMSAIAEREARLTRIADGIVEPPKSKNAKPWYNSPKQLAHFLYDTLGLKVVRHKKTGKPTTDDAALATLAKREPAIKPLLDLIAEKRSLGVFLNTFLLTPLDHDKRIRCSFNPAGTETYRFSSSSDAFGFGGNLQNISTGGALLPNLRRLFIPDEGYVILDCDLDRADLQVVVWEADDEELKAMLREGVDIHAENAKVLGVSRPMAKMAVHAMNYGVGPRTMASNLGITVREAEEHRARWFAAHPGIREWHRRTEEQLMTQRYVENRFGYRRYFFDRIEGLLPEALAWVPQSTVAIVTNTAWTRIHEHLPEVQVLLQVHDSLVMQIPEYLYPSLLPRLREQMLIEIPYPDPLVIPWGVKASKRSWGECKEVDWNTGREKE